MPVKRRSSEVFNVEKTHACHESPRSMFDLRECERHPLQWNATLHHQIKSKLTVRGRTTGNGYREQLSFSIDMHVKAICQGARGTYANSYYAERISRFTSESTGCRATSLIDFLSEKWYWYTRKPVDSNPPKDTGGEAYNANDDPYVRSTSLHPPRAYITRTCTCARCPEIIMLPLAYKYDLNNEK